ncbi:hypothetical protein [Halococcoides cellulosivorans]|uniref:DUF8074 domain-containing protein n=1 Tax=Halococcoides cellulosivorans TaxID=1679096 RepID=A0A2R4X2U5_9EURY|nr:hypothetical protein [Halococcoides cellulosivorans]AWB28033.1 hypothetical protein HARCEL1_10090 [Halococcoides cellulosivorans]
MDLHRIDVAIFVYNVAVVASGAAVVTSMEIESPVVGVGAAVVIGLAWTVYVRLSLIDRLLDLEAVDERASADDTDAGDGGARPPWER